MARKKKIDTITRTCLRCASVVPVEVDYNKPIVYWMCWSCGYKQKIYMYAAEV